MSKGTPLNRTSICVLIDGSIVIDKGNGKAQDMYSGAHQPFREGEFSHVATDRELDQLKRAGLVTGYTNRQAYITALSESASID